MTLGDALMEMQLLKGFSFKIKKEVQKMVSETVEESIPTLQERLNDVCAA